MLDISDSHVSLGVVDLDGNGIGPAGNLEPFIETAALLELKAGETYSNSLHCHSLHCQLPTPLFFIFASVAPSQQTPSSRISVSRVYFQERVNSGPTFEDVVY